MHPQTHGDAARDDGENARGGPRGGPEVVSARSGRISPRHDHRAWVDLIMSRSDIALLILAGVLANDISIGFKEAARNERAVKIGFIVIDDKPYHLIPVEPMATLKDPQ